MTGSPSFCAGISSARSSTSSALRTARKRSCSPRRIRPTSFVGPDLQPVEARLLFRYGAPLTGQSDHLVNVQLGIEDTDRLSQATLLFNYASERVTSRGPIQGSARQPDIVERPGLRVDFVARQAVPLGGVEAKLQLEARNLFGQDYREVQEFGDNLVSINSYDVGTSFSLGLKVLF